MKRMVLVLVVAFLLAPAGHAFAQIVVPLTPAAMSAAQVGAFWAQRMLPAQPTKPASVKSIPPLTGQACYMTTDLGGKPVVMLLDLSSTPKLYVDSDRDGNLADKKPFIGKLIGGGSSGGLLGAIVGAPQKSFSFSSVALALKNPDVNCEVSIQGTGSNYAIMQPASVRAGRVTLDGVSRQVEVMDTTMDGRYDSAFGSPGPGRYNWDLLILDVNGDGRLATSSLTTGEVMPLPSVVQVGKSWYGIKVAADGSSMTFTPAEPPMGKLDVGSKQVEMDVFSDSGYHHLAQSENGWDLPAGHYQVFSMRLAETVSGMPWTLSASWPTGKLEGFTVQPNATTAIPAGAPLVSEVSFTGVRPMVSLEYALKGRAGEKYSAGAERRGIEQSAPVFVILTADSKRIASGMFEYG